MPVCLRTCLPTRPYTWCTTCQTSTNDWLVVNRSHGLVHRVHPCTSHASKPHFYRHVGGFTCTNWCDTGPENQSGPWLLPPPAISHKEQGARRSSLRAPPPPKTPRSPAKPRGEIQAVCRCALIGVPCRRRVLSIFGTFDDMLKLTRSPQARLAETDPHQGTPTRAGLQPPREIPRETAPAPPGPAQFRTDACNCVYYV